VLGACCWRLRPVLPAHAYSLPLPVQVYRQVARDGAVGFSMGSSYIKHSLASILLFYYRDDILRWQVPQTILFYQRDEVQVPQVPHLYGMLVGYGSESVTVLDSDILGKIPRARNPRGTRARTKVQLVTASSYPVPASANPPTALFDSARSGLSGGWQRLVSVLVVGWIGRRLLF
jgi:hypothetical protein